MINNFSERFKQMGGEEIDRIWNILRLDLPELRDWQMSGSFVIESDRTISFVTLKNDSGITGQKIQINSKLNEFDVIHFSNENDNVELIKMYQEKTRTFCEKYKAYMDKDGLVSERFYVIDDGFIKTKTTTAGTSLETNLDKQEVQNSLEVFEGNDLMDFMKSYMANLVKQ